MQLILFGLWFFLPAGAANVAPILAAKIPGLRKFSYPFDCYVKMGNTRILGDHKTWRGLIAGLFFGTLTAVVQFFLVLQFPEIFSFVPQGYMFANPILLGLLLSFGALFGDMIKSYFKRQFAIPEGKSWLGFDQSDYVVGGLVCSSLLLSFSPVLYLTVIIEWISIHLVASYIGYLLALKSQPI